YMPLKKYGVFLIFGFVMTSYLGVPMVGISLLTLIFAVLIYRDLEEKAALQAATVCGGNGDNEDE
ncbi:MAG: PTS sugar transporter subunit IIC, partial [Traorella sp.]